MNTQPVILFDGICNLCNKSVQFVIRHDAHAIFRFASLQSNTGKQLLQQYGITDERIQSFVLIKNNRAFTKSTAALLVAKQLSGPIKLIYAFILVPTCIRDAVYKLIAKNRYKWFGRKDSCMVPAKSLENRFLN